MPSYGYMISQVCARKHAVKEPLRLGTLRPADDPSESGGADALELLYGIMHGLVDHRLTTGSDKTRHLTIKSVTGIGRCVKFTYEIGRSGQASTITDPDDDSGSAPFNRSPRHIETQHHPRRGLLVLPDRSTAGMLVVEAHGRSTRRDVLRDELKRSFRRVTDGLILDVDPVADAAALARYLEEANINAINLRRYSIPHDLAENMGQAEEAGSFSMKTQITGPFKRVFLKRLQNESDVRRRLLVMNDLDYNELNVETQSGDRTLTMSVIGDQAPRFINVIGSSRPSDQDFYASVNGSVSEVASGLGVSLPSNWATEGWSPEGAAYRIEPVTSSEEDADGSGGNE
ncbi:hypothetical protein Psed_5772 [Pseudonocardia dioxanivorans CB1190]|uniref:Uncharacterized protein n=1 Tax=Pseudonocardia dioxanivorans (strain ATCC 55486 / DSM 44775 / JCM 13855 / CB1190) TaxID=675635 RepID=F4D1B1_PSEUX|nr:hypothetical protein [Pseudonocardia dioxanivorans]AEA27899.1 hypothetical protein Psed_5772 [Pseudonocardia dioxanivorans CB1190]